MSSPSPSDDASATPAVSARRYLTKQELVGETGLSEATIQRLKDAGRIPFFQPAGKGGRLLFPPDAIERLEGDASAAGTGATAPAKKTRLSGPPPRWLDE